MTERTLLKEETVLIQDRWAWISKQPLGHPEQCGLWLSLADEDDPISGVYRLSSIGSRNDMEMKTELFGVEYC